MIKNLLSTIMTAAIGSSEKEAAIGGFFAAIGTTLATALGGWDIALKILLYAMLFDYATGLLAAVKGHVLNSDVMYWGGVRKAVVLGVVGLCVMLDQLFGYDDPVIRTGAVIFYLAREGLSIVENLGKLNVLVPDIVKERLQQLKGGDKS